MKIWLFIISLVMVAMIFLMIFLYSASLTVDNTTVRSLNLERFMGRWYEIARFDHHFERDLTHCSTIYSLQPDGTVRITNEGLKRGRWHSSTGKGKLTNQPGVLRVSFFGPFYSDYRVLMLDPDYTYALIGGSNNHYLWILSRTPTLDENTRYTILQEAEIRGYETNNLIWVDQEPRL